MLHDAGTEDLGSASKREKLRGSQGGMKTPPMCPRREWILGVPGGPRPGWWRFIT